MQIRPGGEKLSDTKVGEFDRRPLLFRLSAMQPMQRALPPIITDPVIRTSAACCWWNRLLCSRRTKQEWEGKLNLFHFREESCNFFFFALLLSGNEQMVINVRRGNLPSLGQVFPADTIFSVQGRKWNFSVRCITSRPPSSSSSALPFYQEREEGASSPSPNREVVFSNNMPYTSEPIRSNRVVSIYRIIWWRISDLFFS